MRIKDMNNKETAAHLREYIKTKHGLFSWPTDACGYDQHMKFVNHRNKHWHEQCSWEQFVLNYADVLAGGAE